MSAEQTTATGQTSEQVLDPWLLSVALVWGLNTVANKWVLDVMDPAGILFFRFATCSVILSAAAWWSNGKHGGTLKRPWGIMLLIGLWTGIQQLVFIYALDMTTASEASLLISIAPIWTAIIGAAVGIEITSRANWAGIIIASAGVGLVVLGGGKLDLDVPARIRGDLLMIFSSILYGSFMAFSKGFIKQYGALRVMSWAFAFGCIAVVPAGLPQFVTADLPSFDALVWGALIFSALISGGYGFIVWYRTIARTTPAKTAVYQYLVPVVALIGAAVFLGERLAPVQLTGSAIVILGLVLARRPSKAAAPSVP